MRVGVPIRAAASTPIPAATRTARKPRRRRYLRGAKLQSGGILLCASLCLTMGESASRGALPHIPSFRKKIIIITMIKKKKSRSGEEKRRGSEGRRTPAPTPHGLAPTRLRAPHRPLTEPPPPAAQLTSRWGRARAPPPWFSPGG